MTAFESPALIRFYSDEPFPTDKARQRELIDQQVREYLARGGVIEVIDPEESAERHYPLRPQKRVLVNLLKRRMYQGRIDKLAGKP